MSEKISTSPRPESPIVLDCINLEGDRTQFRFAFEGKAYDMAGPKQTQVEFTAWLPEYAAKTPRCACCERVIFPGQPVTVGHITPEDSGYSHFNPQCNDTAAGFAGSFDNDGESVSPFVA